ncbi:ATP-binding protein [Nesterenkonia flava]
MRARILAAVVGLAALALVVSGYTALWLQQLRVEARVDAELSADAEEFRQLHEVGVDPTTGEPFASPEDLVRTAMQRVIPATNEGIGGYVGERMEYTAPVADVAIHEDPELRQVLSQMAVGDRARFVTTTTDLTTYRSAVVPVHPSEEQAEEGMESAALVLVYDLEREQRVFSEVFIIYAAVAAFSLLVVGLVGWIVAGRVLYPIRVLASTSRRIGGGRDELSERIPVSGRDDLAEMTESVNAMLDRLEGSFRAQDQLIHDVSHELRTPITIVRGHLEVLDPADPQDVDATRELTLDELKRMNRVVDDLTTLAQADHPGFVQPEPTDIGILTDEMYDKAVALGQRRWRVSHRAEGVAMMDRERITQAWLQLAANAVKFSPPDSVIALASVISSDEVGFSVRDQGQGIAPEDVDRIFERFERTDRSAPGSGLGLPIVQAIAAAHDGRVEVDSEPGAGSTFTIVIPAPDIIEAEKPLDESEDLLP